MRFRRLLALAAVIPLAGCYTERGSGQVALASHDLAGFDRVSLVGDGELAVGAGAFGVTVSAEDNVMPSLTVEVDGDTLVLRRDSDWSDGVRPTFPIEFMVTMPALDELRVSGSGAASVRDLAAAGELVLTVAGSGSIRADSVRAASIVAEVEGSGTVSVDGVDLVRLASRIDGAGRVTATGRADELSVDIGGSGLHRSTSLRAASADVEIAGSGQALVWVEGALDVQINGSGTVTYRGDAAVTAVGAAAGQVHRQGGRARDPGAS